jgi:hypothetical protein
MRGLTNMSIHNGFVVLRFGENSPPTRHSQRGIEPNGGESKVTWDLQPLNGPTDKEKNQ